METFHIPYLVGATKQRQWRGHFDAKGDTWGIIMGDNST